MTEAARSPHWEEVTGALEVWERDGESQFFGIIASLNDYPEWPWTVEVAATEFLRKDPLQTQFFRAMTRALRSVNGVVKAAQEDREVWLISGAPFLPANHNATITIERRIGSTISYDSGGVETRAPGVDWERVKADEMRADAEYDEATEAAEE